MLLITVFTALRVLQKRQYLHLQYLGLAIRTYTLLLLFYIHELTSVPHDRDWETRKAVNTVISNIKKVFTK